MFDTSNRPGPEDLPIGAGIDDPAILDDIQGNILRGYNMSYVRHYVVRVDDADAARAFIGDSLTGSNGVPALTTAGQSWDPKPPWCLNVGITATGLRALGLDEAAVKTFPEEFVEGVARRALKLGDVDGSAPANWRDGLDDAARCHVMWTIYAQAAEGVDSLEEIGRRLTESWRRSGAFEITTQLDGAKFDTYPNGSDADRDKVHFGYRDGISQPRFAVDGEMYGRQDDQPIASVGSVLLGRVNGDDDDPLRYRTSYPDVQWQMPEAVQNGETIEIGFNGTFNAFRVLEQDVDAFEQLLEDGVRAIDEQLAGRNVLDGDRSVAVDKELVAAKLMGRWRDGTPLSGARGADLVPGPDKEGLNNFDYPDKDEALDDFHGTHCPLGAHIRRGNPRGSQIVQRSANYTRPIVRRGMPYGPPYDPDNPNDGQRRGLLGNFLCSSLIGQFEAVMYDWINLGLQDPRLTGTSDPLIGANHASNSRFEIPVTDADGGEPHDPVTLTGFPRLTQTVGSLYLFCPSVTTLRFIADPSIPFARP